MVCTLTLPRVMSAFLSSGSHSVPIESPEEKADQLWKQASVFSKFGGKRQSLPTSHPNVGAEQLTIPKLPVVLCANKSDLSPDVDPEEEMMPIMLEFKVFPGVNECDHMVNTNLGN